MKGVTFLDDSELTRSSVTFTCHLEDRSRAALGISMNSSLTFETMEINTTFHIQSTSFPLKVCLLSVCNNSSIHAVSSR